MKFTLNWLKIPLDTTATADEIALKLTSIGHEVEDVVDKAKLYAPFTIAEIRATEKHPNADRLKVCKVWTGSEELQIVCGAPNARAGIKVVLSRPGDYIPGLNVTLKPSKIRDVESQGMMCSEDELCLANERAGGIIEVPEDAPVGGKYADYAGLNDVLFDVSITPNRGDAACVYGIARDLAAAGLGTLKPIPDTVIKGEFKSPINVHIDADSGCRHFCGRYIRGVKNGPSPEWLQRLLISVGLRPISALVDITNFFTLDLARPLHVYDAAKVKGDLRVRQAKDGETLTALNGKTYALKPGMCVIADDNGIESIGGIIGGELSGCSAETTDVFLEGAWFEPISIARTGRALECLSDARYRFERGVDPLLTRPSIDLATALILEICGGTASEVVVAGAPIDQSRTIAYDPALSATLGGIDVPAAKQKELLEKLGARVTEKGARFNVTTPSWRPDWHGSADCVEEIVRLVGLDAVPNTPLPDHKGAPMLSRGQRLTWQAKRALAVQGLQEAVTWSFIPPKIAALWGQTNPALQISNPISVELATMRPSILPTLLMAAAHNIAHGQSNGALFEIGPVFDGVEASEQPVQVSGVRFGATGERHWRGAAASRAVDAYDAKTDVLALLEAVGFPTGNLKLQDIPASPPIYHPGQSGQLTLGKDRIARFGALHPAVLEALDVKGAAIGFEIDWVNVLALMTRKKEASVRPLLSVPELQSVTRDFAFLVAQDVQAYALTSAIAAADKTLVTDVRVFDVYTGKGVPEGQKSLAIEVTLQPRDKTLTDEDLQRVSLAITQAAEKATGAKIRG